MCWDPNDPVPDVARTLVASGFTIDGLTRHGPYSEFRCTRETLLGATVAMLLVVGHHEELTDTQIEDLERAATTQGRSLVLVAGARGPRTLSYSDLFDAVGGAVPSWRALADTYSESLAIASTNQLPDGETGEAWLLFERLVSDGLEFVFGRRTRHLGGMRRGAALPDVIAQLPDRSIIVVDAKATRTAFDAGVANLRPLGEYLQLVEQRQTGGFGVFGALVVAPRFEQGAERLSQVALEFGAGYGRPVSFLAADDLAEMVGMVATRPILRNSLRWKHILRGGAATPGELLAEVEAATAARVGDE